jgi:hypothetical protein
LLHRVSIHPNLDEGLLTGGFGDTPVEVEALREIGKLTGIGIRFDELDDPTFTLERNVSIALQEDEHGREVWRSVSGLGGRKCRTEFLLFLHDRGGDQKVNEEKETNVDQ